MFGQIDVFVDTCLKQTVIMIIVLLFTIIIILKFHHFPCLIVMCVSYYVFD